MSITIPLLGFTPVVSAPSVVADQWDVQAEVDDPTERFSGFDVDVGDVVFLDLLSSTTAPGTAGRYLIEAILSRSASAIRVVLSWGGVGIGVDPIEGAGHRGYLTRSSERNSLAWQPTSRVLGVDPDLIQAAKNTESFAVVDKFAPATSNTTVDQVARDRQVRAITADRSFTIGQTVTRRGGLTDLACPQDDLRMPAIGVALGMGAGTVLVQSYGIVSNSVFHFEPGLPLFVANNGGLTQDASEVTRPGWLQVVGVALDVSTVSFNFTGQMTYRG